MPEMMVICPKHGRQRIRHLAADNGLVFDSCLVEEVVAFLVCGCRVELFSLDDPEEDIRTVCKYCRNPFVPDKKGLCMSCGGSPLEENE